MIIAWPLWALRIGGFLKGLPWQVYAGLALAAALPITYCKGVSDGREQERSIWEAKVAEIREARKNTAAESATKDQDIKDDTEDAIRTRRKDLDDATSKLPDQELTDRQLARVCAERKRRGLQPGRRCELSATTSERVD